MIPYCDNYEDILHNSLRYVIVPFLQSLPFEERRTLQLVYTLELIITGEPRSIGIKWRGSLITKQGEELTDASITNFIFVDQLDSGYRPKNPCLGTYK